VSLHHGVLRLRASGDNGYCPSGRGRHYVVWADGKRHTLKARPTAAGKMQRLRIASLVRNARNVRISEVDAAGNLSYPVTLRRHGKTVGLLTG
jgi:hypothetical protein